MEAAASATASLIQAHPDLNMIFAPFVSAALGAERAATEADKTDTDNFYIASVDGSVDMLKLIKQGSVLQSSSSTLFRYDAVIVEMDMERLLLGEKVPPFRLQIPKIVTKENVDELLAILDDPFNPKNEYIYSEITTYLDTPWEPGVALPDPDLPIKPVSLNPLSRFTE
jgi:ABC-type sugar transport system substrate-binding protein